MYNPNLGRTGKLSKRIDDFRSTVKDRYPTRTVTRPSATSFRGLPRPGDEDTVTIGRSEEWYRTQCSIRLPTGYSGPTDNSSGTFMTVLSPRHKAAQENKEASFEARQAEIAEEKKRIEERHAAAVS